jgi:hypothetical protein
VEAIVKENRLLRVHERAAHPDMSHGSAHHIIHDVLQFHKVSARWVPRQLTAELKEGCVGVETWVHYHQPETKKVSKEWCHTPSPKPKKFHTQPSVGKVMLTLFWDE